MDTDAREMSESDAPRSSLYIEIFCLWGLMKSKLYKRKVGAPNELLAHILDADARINKSDHNSDEQHAILAQGLRNALRLTVGFSNIYCATVTNTSLLCDKCHFKKKNLKLN